MIAGLSMRITQAADYEEPRDSISHDWLNRLREWQITPVLIPNIQADAPAYLESVGVDILILTGGDDIGATPLRDASENILLEYATAQSMPLLGICRGLQLINDFYGGNSIPVSGHVANPHPVRVSDEWTGFYGDQTIVNSYHNLGINPGSVGDSLVVKATDTDGFVEAVQHVDLPLAAIMWHPERDAAPQGDRALIQYLTGR